VFELIKEKKHLGQIFSIKNSTSWTTEGTQARYELTELNNGVTIMETAIN